MECNRPASSAPVVSDITALRPNFDERTLNAVQWNLDSLEPLVQSVFGIIKGFDNNARETCKDIQNKKIDLW